VSRRCCGSAGAAAVAPAAGSGAPTSTAADAAATAATNEALRMSLTWLLLGLMPAAGRPDGGGESGRFSIWSACIVPSGALPDIARRSQRARRDGPRGGPRGPAAVARNGQMRRPATGRAACRRR